MPVSYQPLWQQLRKRKMKKKDLTALSGVSKSTLIHMWHKDYVALSVIDRICTALDCEIQDVVKQRKSRVNKDGNCHDEQNNFHEQ